ncbi:hypothetical protein DSO57_1008389 [Entomophthora muscae]|uniref:Uncharacterized protein n=1 Tax=Entomophthora muscae TaxID=34485 RepID=A0ACC2TUR3_9FUNG|nr:hypothetical protein DSO57_1008389 [Entomophthora muscae]
MANYGIHNTSYEPLATTKEPSVPMSYATIDSASTTKCDPTFYTKVPIPCVEPASQNAAVRIGEQVKRK